MPNKLIIAAIGASAGGVEALRSMFREVRAGSGIAYIVQLHLDPDRCSQLTEILARECPLPVMTAVDGVLLAADEVQVVPPAVLATVSGGHLVLSPSPHTTHDPRSVDVLFASLARDFNDRAVGVVLSGFGSDGTIGIKAIKEHGGLTVAQGSNGTRPGHSGMPDSAIAGGLVDMVVPSEFIPAKLAEYAQSLDTLAGLTADPAKGSPEEQQPIGAARAAICEILLREVGHDFAGYKHQTFMRRVQRRMQVLHSASLDAYVEQLRGNHDEATALLRDLLISVTAFFRDDDAFAALAEHVIPQLFKGKGAGDTVRVWVPGCATGEEAFSIAMALCEHAGNSPSAPKLRVFATDIDETALLAARAGHYPMALLEQLSPARLDRFFIGDGAIRTVTKEIRDICVFSSHSLIRDPPFSRLDLISCRNLLIYLDAGAQRDIFPLFHFALAPGGCLFLGTAESAVQFPDLFTPLDKHHRIYQWRDNGPARPRFPIPRGLVEARRLAAPSATAHLNSPRNVREAAEAIVLERFAPTHVVVNREGSVVHYSSRTGRYLEAAPGEPTRNILALARPGLRLDIRLALEEALKTRRAATRIGVLPIAPDLAQQTSVTVLPLPETDPAEPLFLIVLTEPEARQPGVDTALPKEADEPAAILTERELRDTRERLQTVIEEYETAVAELRAGNEELVSVNEELQSANEELETSKEEQQSVNEELQTVNQEMKAKVEQLDRALADLKNLFEATRVATITLDRDLAIRSFTPAVAGLFNLRPTDHARPLSDIAGALDTEEILRRAREVLDTGRASEHRMERHDGAAHYLMRLVPYRIADGTVDGVLAAFVDVTQLEDATRETAQQRLLLAELNHRVGNILTVVIALTRQTLHDGGSMAAAREALVGRMETLSRAYQLISHNSWGEISLAELVAQQLAPHLSRPERGVVRGGPVGLRPTTAVTLGLILHELATNSVKYGALSNDIGSVTVSWTATQEGEEGVLDLQWRERGGPPAPAPTRRGFGSQLIHGQVTHALGGKLEQDYAAEGYSARLRLPMHARSGIRAG